MAVAQHMRLGRRHLFQCCQGLFGLALLDHADHGVQHHNGHDHGRLDQSTFVQPQDIQQGRNDCGDDQDHYHKTAQLIEQTLPKRNWGTFLELIGAVDLQPFLGFC